MAQRPLAFFRVCIAPRGGHHDHDTDTSTTSATAIKSATTSTANAAQGGGHVSTLGTVEGIVLEACTTVLLAKLITHQLNLTAVLRSFTPPHVLRLGSINLMVYTPGGMAHRVRTITAVIPK